MLGLLSEVLVLLSEHLYLVLSFKQAPLEVIFLAAGNCNLVLHVAELNHLSLQLLSRLLHIRRLVVELSLDLVDIGIQTRDGVLKVNDLLVLHEQIAFIVS